MPEFSCWVGKLEARTGSPAEHGYHHETVMPPLLCKSFYFFDPELPAPGLDRPRIPRQWSPKLSPDQEFLVTKLYYSPDTSPDHNLHCTLSGEMNLVTSPQHVSIANQFLALYWYRSLSCFEPQTGT